MKLNAYKSCKKIAWEIEAYAHGHMYSRDASGNVINCMNMNNYCADCTSLFKHDLTPLTMRDYLDGAYDYLAYHVNDQRELVSVTIGITRDDCFDCVYVDSYLDDIKHRGEGVVTCLDEQNGVSEFPLSERACNAITECFRDRFKATETCYDDREAWDAAYYCYAPNPKRRQLCRRADTKI